MFSLPAMTPQGKIAALMGLLAAAYEVYMYYMISAGKLPGPSALYKKMTGGKSELMGLLTALLFTLVITAFSVFIADALSRENYNLLSWAFVLFPLANSFLVKDIGLVKKAF